MMLKRLKVVCKAITIDVEVNVVTIDHAYDYYNKFKDCDVYSEGYIMDNETGELYATFNKESDGNGMKITEWVAVF